MGADGKNYTSPPVRATGAYFAALAAATAAS
jgi:hypothetical protein